MQRLTWWMRSGMTVRPKSSRTAGMYVTQMKQQTSITNKQTKTTNQPTKKQTKQKIPKYKVK